MDPPLDDISFLASSTHRIGVLEALAEGPRSRAELLDETGGSSSTIGRVLGDFEERRWIRRDGPTYELTPLGEFVGDRFDHLREGMAIERKLRDVWRWLPREMAGFSIGLFADAVVSRPGEGYPYDPVDRVTRLIEETDSMRGFGTTVFKSGNLETLCRNALEGMTLEYVYTPSVLETVVRWDPAVVARVVERPTCSILLHDRLPDQRRCGLCLFDDRIGICCHDADSGHLRAVVDTDAPEAREWAESVFERYRSDARPLEGADVVTGVESVS